MDEYKQNHLIPSRTHTRNISDTRLVIDVDSSSNSSFRGYTQHANTQHANTQHIRPRSLRSEIRVIKEKADIELLEREQKLREEYFIQSNGWNENIEKDIKKIGDKAEGWRWMHKNSAAKFTKLYHIWGVINVCICLLLGVGSIPNILTCQSNWDILKWFVTVIQFLISCSLGVAHFLDYGGRKQNHKTAESGFATLFFHIKTQLGMDRKSRQNGEHYAEWIQKEYTDLSSNPDIPGIPGDIYKMYLKKIEGTGISNIDELDTISIYKDPPGIIFGGIVTPQSADETIERFVDEDYTRSSHSRRPITITVPKKDKMSGIDKWNLKRHYDNE